MRTRRGRLPRRHCSRERRGATLQATPGAVCCGRLAIAVLDSLDDEPADEGVAEAWATEVLARSAAYSRGELQAVDWRAALQEIESDLNEMSS